VTGAGPIWHNFMEQALANRPVLDFVQPGGIVALEVCADSGTQPSPYCPNRKQEIFFVDQPPPPADQDWYRMTSCGGDPQVRIVLPDDAYAWAIQQPAWQNLPLASESQCAPGVVQPGQGNVVITSPAEGSAIAGLVPVFGTVTMPDFDHYDLTYGAGWNPREWEWISGPHKAEVTNGQLGEWHTGDLGDGEYTLRITVYGQQKLEYRVRVRVQNSAPIEPTVTPTEVAPLPTAPPDTPTPAPTDTATPASTEAPTPTFTLTLEATSPPPTEVLPSTSTPSGSTIAPSP
jgi:hypothetical protein